MQIIVNHVDRSARTAHQHARLAAYARLIGQSVNGKKTKNKKEESSWMN